MTTTAIHSRALLVWLTISTWSARRYDKKISQEVNTAHNASSDAGRYNKFLLPGDAATYKTLTALVGSIRAQHYNHSLAWSDAGWRLLPTANYMQYTKWFRDQQRIFTSQLDSFAADYPSLRAQAKIKLNGLYRDEDYPTVQDIRSKFALSVEYSPLPASGDLRVDLGADQIAAIEAAIIDRQGSALKMAVSDSWHRLYDVVSKISERLNTPDAIFRDSLIGNARDVCDTLKRLNVTDDPQLESMRATVMSELASASPDLLRDKQYKSHRATVAQSADDILARMRATMPAGAADLVTSNG